MLDFLFSFPGGHKQEVEEGEMTIVFFRHRPQSCNYSLVDNSVSERKQCLK